MKFCSVCGKTVGLKIPEGDDKPRFVCEHCLTIHYSNPRMVVGAIPEWDGKLLLCKRAIKPALGRWTLPAGYLENGETVFACAVRETFEEAGAELEELEPYTLVNLPFINQIYFMYRASLKNDRCRPGIETLEVKFVSPEEIPWEELAFASIKEVLRLYCTDLEHNFFPFREVTIDPEKPE